MIEVILWDIDGTLLDFPASERHALQQCFADFGLGPCPEDRVERYSVLNLSYWKRLERGEITKPQLLTQRFQEFFQSEGITPPDCAAFNAAYQYQLGETILFLDNGYDLVKEMKDRGLRQYAVTNGALAAQSRKLKNSGLGELFDGVFISEEVGAEKPNPLFFQRVLENIGPVDKEDLLLVGDSLTSDMAGGCAAAIPCCWYNPAGEAKPQELDIRYTISHLSQLRDIVGKSRGW